MPQPSIPDPLARLLDDAVLEVFAIMLPFPCTPAPGCRTQLPGLTASVLFSGSLTGTCAVYLDLVSAGVLTQQLIGERPGPDSPLLADMVGELCNMIAGSWKSRLAAPLATCQLSPPTVTRDTLPTCTRAYTFLDHYFNLELILA